MKNPPHQYVERTTGAVRTERIYADGVVNFLYARARESAPAVFRALTGARASSLLAYLNYDFPFGPRLSGKKRFLRELGVNLDECVDPPEALDSARKVFERKIRYWECRPMPPNPKLVVSPADAKVLVGSLRESSSIFIKEKFFDYDELLGPEKREWLRAFAGGDYAVFRLTPEMYHYNHTPVAGRVEDFYEIDGVYHSCNPTVVIHMASPLSKNKRTVTVIDTDVPGGTGVGLVAMIEVVALMIGDMVQVYSANEYREPRALTPGMYLARGVPKSVYRPGSSTDVLLFERGRVRFDADLLRNLNKAGVVTRFSNAWGKPLVETRVAVRSSIASRNES